MRLIFPNITSLTYVIEGEPLHNVDNKLIIVDTLGDDLDSEEAWPLGVDGITLEDVAALDKRLNKTSIKLCSANGAGSIPLRMKRSANDAKHFKAPSATW